MTASSPEPTGGPVHEWIAVLEFARPDRGQLIAVDDVSSLLDELREWDALALISPDRYTVQLRVPARTPYDALRSALACHHDAARTARLPAATLQHAEIVTAEVLGPNVSPTPRSVLCHEVYTATRRLVAATTPAELADTVASCVTAIGGRVRRGRAPGVAGNVELDVSIQGDQSVHATAEALSVTGLIMEHSMPTLIDDARHALVRLRAGEATA
jgi:hypothetical protein